MARQRNPFITWILTTASVSFCRLMSLLPLPVCRAIGRALGRVAYALIPRVHKVALDNVRRAYGDTISDKQARAIARGAAENVGIVAAEFSHLPRLTAENYTRWVKVEGTEHLDHERGGFIVGAHLGNWEWMATIVAHMGYQVAEVVRPLDAPALNAYVDAIRTSLGVRTIDKTGGGQEMIRLLKEGWITGVLADQSPRDSAVPVTFFGRPCWATIGPAMVALRIKVPIYIVTMVRNADGNYTFSFSAPVQLDRTGDLRRDFQTISQRCQDMIEERIRSHPEQWLWLHRRWKSRPRLQEEWDRKNAGNAKSSD